MAEEAAEIRQPLQFMLSPYINLAAYLDILICTFFINHKTDDL